MVLIRPVVTGTQNQFCKSILKLLENKEEISNISTSMRSVYKNFVYITDLRFITEYRNKYLKKD